MTRHRPAGAPLGRIDREHRRVFDAAGYIEQRQWTAGYSLGATFPPRGLMDYPPLLYADNPSRPTTTWCSSSAVLYGERSSSAMAARPRSSSPRRGASCSSG